jgi:hypothetical protein
VVVVGVEGETERGELRETLAEAGVAVEVEVAGPVGAVDLLVRVVDRRIADAAEQG